MCDNKEKSTKKKCAISTRTAIKDVPSQKPNSLKSQRDACETYIANQGWEIRAEPYDDEAGVERPAFQRLLADIEAGTIDMVIVGDLNRLTRSLPDLVEIIDLFETKKVGLVGVNLGFDTTSARGRFAMNLLKRCAEYVGDIRYALRQEGGAECRSRTQ